jgi:hypothetical protein
MILPLGRNTVTAVNPAHSFLFPVFAFFHFKLHTGCGGKGT